MLSQYFRMVVINDWTLGNSDSEFVVLFSGYYFWFVPWNYFAKTRLLDFVGSDWRELQSYEPPDGWTICYQNSTGKAKKRNLKHYAFLVPDELLIVSYSFAVSVSLSLKLNKCCLYIYVKQSWWQSLLFARCTKWWSFGTVSWSLENHSVERPVHTECWPELWLISQRRWTLNFFQYRLFLLFLYMIFCLSLLCANYVTT